MEIPSPYSPFVHVEWHTPYEGLAVTRTSLEHLAYRPFGFKWEDTA